MKRQKVMLLVATVIVISAVGAAGWIHHRHVNNTKTDSVNTPQSTANAPTKGPTSTNDQTAPPAAGTTTPNSSPQGAGPMLSPGNYVSNHRPQLSNANYSQEQSVCNTSPGATCVIEFSQNGVTKSLPTKTADNYGSVYWNWTLQDIGLNSGSWQITAKATLNGQTKSAQDALGLDVQP